MAAVREQYKTEAEQVARERIFRGVLKKFSPEKGTVSPGRVAGELKPEAPSARKKG
jgi:hypothetical protein